MGELELRHLRAIRAVADAGSLSKAAVALGISQPALTAQLQRLERRIGGQLFARTATGVVPTDLGSYVLGVARLLLSDVDNLMAGIRQRTHAAGSAGTVRVGGPPGPHVPLFASAIAEHLTGADVTIEIDMQPADLVRKVHDHQLDFALLEENPGFRTPIPAPLHSKVVLRPPLFVGMSERHRLAGQDVIDLAELANESWIMPPLAAGNEQLAFARACADLGFTPRIRHEVFDSTTARALVTAGALSLANPLAREGNGVVIRALAGNPLVQEIVLVWDGEQAEAAMSDEAEGWVLQAYAQLADNNVHLRRWWDSNPDKHTDDDPALTSAR